MVRAIIEIMGTPKEHVEETMKSVVDKVKQEKSFQLIKHSFFECKQIEQSKFWSTFAEVEISFPGVDQLVLFCFNFMPSSLEILEPAKATFEQREIGNLFNDLLARLHQYDMVLKNLHAETVVLRKKVGSAENK